MEALLGCFHPSLAPPLQEAAEAAGGWAAWPSTADEEATHTPPTRRRRSATPGAVSMAQCPPPYSHAGDSGIIHATLLLVHVL